jgi:hypothetical protein
MYTYKTLVFFTRSLSLSVCVCIPFHLYIDLRDSRGPGRRRRKKENGGKGGGEVNSRRCLPTSRQGLLCHWQGMGGRKVDQACHELAITNKSI